MVSAPVALLTAAGLCLRAASWRYWTVWDSGYRRKFDCGCRNLEERWIDADLVEDDVCDCWDCSDEPAWTCDTCIGSGCKGKWGWGGCVDLRMCKNGTVENSTVGGGVWEVSLCNGCNLPAEWENDNFCDCPDCSDESDFACNGPSVNGDRDNAPSTRGFFLCSDGCKVLRDFQNDGVCHCSDCGDEEHWTCSNCTSGCNHSQNCGYVAVNNSGDGYGYGYSYGFGCDTCCHCPDWCDPVTPAPSPQPETESSGSDLGLMVPIISALSAVGLLLLAACCLRRSLRTSPAAPWTDVGPEAVVVGGAAKVRNFTSLQLVPLSEEAFSSLPAYWARSGGNAGNDAGNAGYHSLPSDQLSFDELFYVSFENLRLFQDLMDQTYRPIPTQDRPCPRKAHDKTRGGCACVRPGGVPGLPTGFQVKRVIRVLAFFLSPFGFLETARRSLKVKLFGGVQQSAKASRTRRCSTATSPGASRSRSAARVRRQTQPSLPARWGV